MNTSTLKATYRETSGSARARVLRRNGMLPAVVYGAGKDVIHVTVDPLALRAALRTPLRRNTLIDLQVEAGNGKAAQNRSVMVREYQTHAVFHEKLQHVDFYELDTTKAMRVRVPVEITGKSPAIKEGGIQEVKFHELLVECLPNNIPAKIQVEVGHLKLRESVHIADVKMPEGVKAIFETNFTVVTISLPAREKTAAEIAQEAADAAAAAGEGAGAEAAKPGEAAKAGEAAKPGDAKAAPAAAAKKEKK